nr:piggyBac transposable element-derived protein 4-like [Onthophagus taurus]
MRCLHFSSDDKNNKARLARIRPVMDHFNTKMQSVYSSGKELSLDESMVLWRGRLAFRQYIKNRKHKYGVKLYMLTEPNGLVQKFTIYHGSTDVLGGAGHTSKVVQYLLQDRLHQGHSVDMDRYYNSYELASYLLQNKTYCTGTLNIRRKNNPRANQEAKLKPGDNKSLFYNGVHIGKWTSKRDVLYITTEYGNNMAESRNKRGQVTLKPLAIINHNKYMSGIDQHDQMLSYYPCVQKTMRWYKKIFIHVLQMSVINSYILYKKYSGNRSKSIYEYRLALLESLLPKVVPKATVTLHELRKIEKTTEEVYQTPDQTTKKMKRVVRKECKVCRSNKKRTATMYICNSCEGSPGFRVKCFFIYHKQ